MDHLVVVATVKNEAPYIYEWLSYHHNIGVDRFYIYNNGSTDNTLDVIRAWPYSSLVTVFEWPGSGVQLDAYCDMIEQNRHVAEWCAFIDVDEFLCPTADRSVPDILRGLPGDCTGLYVHWMFFGSSGYQSRPSGLVTDTFIRRGWDDFEPNGIGKTIVRLQYASGPLGVHVVQSNGRLVNDSGQELDQANAGYYATNRSHRLLSLNHYFTKSLEEWRVRRRRGRATKLPDAQDYFRTDEDFRLHDVNEVLDTRAAEIMRSCTPRYYPTLVPPRTMSVRRCA
jgi:glycosyltransferase involved in cell wall biosynthesis